ncbi:nitronate monooxygenase [Flavobacterium sp. CSZ]|uniref:NAD(P)H-dependent flavin oxidoreductase n=1 Tax=Flavobacterium sp. CSZ TaxID=2783791 RepID=UPI00188B8558|nr:nitronate monooxygenase [Flavobacterium sp. CSZ]MBF4485730.1 nitronate monooxygenase [Flavobacterium sp. CSZ]
MNWKNDVTRLLNIEYPIIQAPMYGVTTSEMVKAASRANCLGSLPLGDLPADKCIEAIIATKKLVDRTFAVNIFVNTIPELTEDLKEKYTSVKKFIEHLAGHHNLEINLPKIEEIRTKNYHDQIDAIISEGCKILSFTFGNLDKQSIDKLKSNGTILIGTCTSVNEAIILEKSGIDIICVQGVEAGGHRGSFAEENIPEIGGLSLLSKVYDCTNVPLIYAGGIYNARTLMATQTLGAQGFQIGSLFLGSSESALKEFEKQRLRNLDEADIVLTKSFSGRYARGIRNTFTDSTELAQQILPYPYQNKLTNELRKIAKENNNVDFVSIWTGQSINEYSEKSTFEIIKKLIKAVDNNL